MAQAQKKAPVTPRLEGAIRFEVIPPVFPYSKRTQCEHTLTKPMQSGQVVCTTRAAYLVNGVSLCERHTGRELILYHLRQIGVFKLPGDKLG